MSRFESNEIRMNGSNVTVVDDADFSLLEDNPGNYRFHADHHGKEIRAIASV